MQLLVVWDMFFGILGGAYYCTFKQFSWNQYFLPDSQKNNLFWWKSDQFWPSKDPVSWYLTKFTILEFFGPKWWVEWALVGRFRQPLPKRGQNTQIAISRLYSILALQILDMLSIEVISTWKHIQNPSTAGSTSIFGLERETHFLVIFGHMAPKMGQSQKNFGLRIKFYPWPNYGFNKKKFSRQRAAKKLKKKFHPEKQSFSVSSQRLPTVRPVNPLTQLFWLKILQYIGQGPYLGQTENGVRKSANADSNS